MENYPGKDIPKLGFGLMRLPMVNGDIDLEQVKSMVDLFLAKGFTYFDTAYGYHNGKSEMTIKEALVDRYPREQNQIATKLPAWFAASLEGIVTVLSGMSTLEQMKDNLSYMENFKPVSDQELSLIGEVQKILAGIPQIPCTDCQYCLKGCPKNIAIPGTLRMMNDYFIYKSLERARGASLLEAK